MENKLQLDRLVFFSDAVVAIAITLLALDLKIGQTESGHLHFSDIFIHWRAFGAFILSFINIANFWKTHHSFFAYITKIDERLLLWNICWLLFITLLPFTTTLLSNYFSDVAAVCTYSIDILLIAFFQNAIWDYASEKKFLKEDFVNSSMEARIRLFCNLDMINGAIGIVVSFFSPILAFILLFTKLPLIFFVRAYTRRKLPRTKRPVGRRIK